MVLYIHTYTGVQCSGEKKRKKKKVRPEKKALLRILTKKFKSHTNSNGEGERRRKNMQSIFITVIFTRGELKINGCLKGTFFV